MEYPSKETDLLNDLENWMTNLPPKLRSAPLIYLAVPGSHDSMTSSITVHSKLAPDAEKFLQRMKFLGPLLRYVMSRWSKTQNYDMQEQLKAGIRYFDLRVATRKGQVYPYFVHGLYATEAVGVLNELKNFLDTHPGEIVILDFNHFYAFEKLDHSNFVRLLLAMFNNKLVPYAHRMQHLTLEHINKLGYQLIVVYRSDNVRYQQPLLWASTSFPSPWPQTISKTELITKLNEGTLKKQCAKPLKKLKQEWIQNQRIGAGGVNIVICDFIDLNDCQFIKEIISLNTKTSLDESGYVLHSLTPVDSSF